ncbi:glycoside hydrolase family 127 protein [Lacibacter luteus]|uniref:Glycoside hydrolase family 127 protein n=1 Tax=Lacibacter luteus TaxID=2508719 RepID=A0A4Q1CKZ3_9BACT|nr:glycoside hydrolase family 127 protein [Lacibacter luteus]RXK61643.1 glycoside hydrolase family 127 protein [Lacibacter luteus]
MKMIYIIFFTVLSNLIYSQSHYPGQHSGKFKLQDQFDPVVKAFDLSDVTMLPSRFTENTDREIKWIMSIPVKSLLHSFRTNAGVFSGLEGGYSPTKGTQKFAGWESLDCEVRGHTAGHILSGLALLYATTKREEFKIKADSIVAGLAEVQEALKQNGYLSAYSQGLIDRNIAGKSVWAPWYTLHKIYSGLIDQYLYCDNKQALDIVTKMGEWAYNKLKPLTEEQRIRMLRNEFGGMNDSFYNLYAITGNEQFKWLAGFFYHNEVLDPLKEKKDVLNPKHANTFIPKLIGLARDYELEGKGDGMSVADFFWNTVIDHHSFATGSNSDKEHFFTPDKISEHLTGYTGESCNTYNMLKLTRHLFIYNPDAKYADYYEKALFNHILGQQDPATGMVAYFLPMLPGAHKLYSTPDSSFWCCVGSGFENQAKYGEAIYYHSANDVYVNLFIPSKLTWKEASVELQQETKFPENGTVVFTVQKTSEVLQKIRVRYPSWAKNASVKINGQKQTKINKQNGYIVLDRKWKAGDKIEISYTMELQLIATNDNADKAAIAYGPIILAGEMGTKGFTGRAPYSDPTQHNDYYTYDFKVPQDISTSLTINRANPSADIKPAEGRTLTFKTKEGITLRPLYDIHRERYVVYWTIQ